MSSINSSFMETISNSEIRCTLCPRLCKIKDGKNGICQIRGVRENRLKLLNYELSTGYALDSIEKKPLYHFYPNSKTLSFGTVGCNLKCKFCQNWETSQVTTRGQIELTTDKITEIALNNSARSISFTYNDPIIFFEYARDSALIAHENNLKTVAVTAGYINEKPREEFFSFIDAANIDLKSFNNSFYIEQCGVHLQNILETIEYVANETDVWLELTTLLIPGLNDSNKEIDNLTKWIVSTIGSSVPIHFSAFHPSYKVTNISNTPAGTLKNARDIAIKNGINYVYTGNINDTKTSSSYCHNCSELLIERSYFEVEQIGLTLAGKCQKCQSKIPGIY